MGASTKVDYLQGVGLRLLAVGQRRTLTFELPAAGEVRVGSGVDCDIRIDEPGVAPVHALLRIGRTVELLGADSRQSVVVGGNALSFGETVTLAPGVVVLLGATPVVLRSSASSCRLRLVRSHDYFTSRLETECARAASDGTRFAVGRVRFGPNQARLIEEVFTRCLCPRDIVAMYAADEYEFLLADLSPEAAEATCTSIGEQVAAGGKGSVCIGLACWERDGQKPEELLVAAGFYNACRPEKGQAAARTGFMDGLKPLLQRIAPSRINILILGETGAGKGVLARRIHELSTRARGPMQSINCAGLPGSLLENELFGHERGAFTGAVDTKPGLLELADGGTVLLDEIADMPLVLQAKLLHVVEQRQLRRLGSSRLRAIDVRFLAATNRDIGAEVSLGRFRQDLYYRLNGITLLVPPLRERASEIDALVTEFISEFVAKAGRCRPQRLSRAALHLLERHPWPGNIRELRSVVEYAVMLCDGDVIELADLPLDRLGHRKSCAPADLERQDHVGDGPEQSKSTPSGAYASGPQALEYVGSCVGKQNLDELAGEVERRRIQSALEQCAGNQTHAARLLGISRRSLLTRIQRYGLPRPRKRRPA